MSGNSINGNRPIGVNQHKPTKSEQSPDESKKIKSKKTKFCENSCGKIAFERFDNCMNDSIFTDRSTYDKILICNDISAKELDKCCQYEEHYKAIYGKNY